MSAGPRAPYRLHLLRGAVRNKNRPNSSVCVRSHPERLRLWQSAQRSSAVNTSVTTSVCRQCPASVRILSLRRLCALALPVLVVQSEGWQTLNTTRGHESATSVCGSAIKSRQLCCTFESRGAGIISKFILCLLNLMFVEFQMCWCVLATTLHRQAPFSIYITTK